MFDQPLLLGMAAAAFVLAGTVKGVIGLGLPAIGIGLLGLFMRPVEAAALMIVPGIVTNLWQLFGGPDLLGLLRRLWLLFVGVTAGIVVGGLVLPLADMKIANTLLGFAVAAYALFGLTAVKFSVPRAVEPWAAPVVGVLTGIIAAPTGIFVVPAVPYMQAIGLEKEDLIQALGLFFTICTATLALVLARTGTLDTPTLALSTLALLPASAGMLFGQWVRKAIDPATFRRVFLLGLLCLGMYQVFLGLR